MIKDLEPGQIAAVVTNLEMRDIPKPNDEVLNREGVTLRRQLNMSCADYLDLFRAVGQDWLWFSRLQISETELETILRDPKTELHTLHNSEDDVIGYLELDCRETSSIEVAFIGLTAGNLSKGLGTYLMNHAFRISSSYHPERLWLHSCTLDHPRAISFYEKMGFVVYGRAIEIVTDPRLDGTMPRNAAPHIAIVQ